MITAHEMRELENKSGIPRSSLMENAGRGIFTAMKERMELKGKKILVVCYHGNNGGDGFAAAMHLADEAETDILFIGDENRLRKEALATFKKAERNEKIQFLVDDEVDFSVYDVIIDAILGIGIHGRLNREISAIINDINATTATKVSIDIPTGIDPDSGQIVENSVNADLIITFHDFKKCLEKHQEKTIVVDIGLPK